MSELNFSAMKVPQLRQIAAESGIKIPPKAKKKDIIELIEEKIAEVKAKIDSGELEVMEPKVIVKEEKKFSYKSEDEKSEDSKSDNTEAKTESHSKDKKQPKKQSNYQQYKKNGSYNKSNKRNVTKRKEREDNQTSISELIDQGECGAAEGMLDIHNDGYGFLRAFDKNQKDTYVSINQIKRFKLRQGDSVKGITRPEKENERYLAMLQITEINSLPPEESARRKFFGDLTPVFPDEKLEFARVDAPQLLAIRLIDLIAPVGKGQRGMIVSPPKAGKTTLLKHIANSIEKNNPDMHLIILLIDERPEEVTDMQRSTSGEVVYSTFDERPENHCKVAEMVLERAKRLVEQDKDVVILLDSITRLARAYNLTVPPSGRTLSGGLDPSALFKPKRFFGAARNIEYGGSLTILATALVDTGSRMDDIVYEEFKGTGNMELHLDRKLQERRVFPAIDLYKSGTRREEVLLSKEEMDAIWQVRKLLSGNQEDSTELLIDMISKTKTNEEFLGKLTSWLSLMEKEGYRQVTR